MRHTPFLLIVVSCLSLSLVPRVHAEPFKDPQFNVRITKDIVYGTAGVRAPLRGRKDLLLDLYEPEGADVPALRPALIAVHGGGFRAGGKSGPESLEDFCREFASRRYVCASIAYRLEGDDPATSGATLHDRAVAAAVDDTAQAVRWMRSNAAARQIDLRRIALAGRSAGAGASMRLAYSRAGRKLHIRAVLDMSGGAGPDLMSIRGGDAPLLIIHGTNDSLVPVANAIAVADRAKEVGLPHEIYLLEGRGNGHVKNFSREVDGVTLLQRTVEFFYKYLDLARLAPQTK